jgi:cell division protein FtsW
LLARLSPYRWERIVSFLHPWEHQSDTGYQLVNSFIAIGSGTWFGAGLGDGVQKLNYLPEAHTDFVFAVLAEELGFVGASLVIGLFALLVWRAFEIGRRAQRRELHFHALLAMGIGLTLGIQAAISIGVNTGLLPTKGLTLPLISFGRSSTIATLFLLGLLFRVAHELGETTLSSQARQSR